MAYVELDDFATSGLPLDKDTLNQLLENIRVLRNPPRYFYQRPFTDADYTLSSGSGFTDIDATNLVCTLETDGNPVQVHFRGAVSNSTTGRTQFEILVDGVPFSNNTSNGLGQLVFDGSAGHRPIDISITVELAAGSHTFQMQWGSAAGNSTLEVEDVIQFEVYET